jgi:hypothetical protein
LRTKIQVRLRAADHPFSPKAGPAGNAQLLTAAVPVAAGQFIQASGSNTESTLDLSLSHDRCSARAEVGANRKSRTDAAGENEQEFAEGLKVDLMHRAGTLRLPCTLPSGNTFTVKAEVP